MGFFSRKRRAPVRDWSMTQVQAQIIACFTTNPDQFEVRSAVVFHQDPELLPEDAPEVWQQEVEAAGETYEGFPEYFTVKLGFSEEDRIPLYMDFDPVCLVYEAEGTLDRTKALEAARSWCEPAQPMPFINIPGVHQGHFLSFILQREVDPGPSGLVWMLPPTSGHSAVRDFPPRKKPTTLTPTPGETSFAIFPQSAVDEINRQREWWNFD